MKDKRELFLLTVTDQIKSKEAKRFVSDELKHHLKEAKQAWIQRGLTDEAAEEKAIAQMGRPEKLGRKFNQLHRPRVDWLLLLLMAITIGIGFLPLLTVESGLSQSLLLKKGITLILAIGAAVVVMLLDYRKLARWGWLFFALGLLLIFVFSYLPSQYINGAPVISIVHMSFDISIVLPVMLLAWACLLYDRRLKNWHLSIVFVISFILMGSIPSMSILFLYAITVLALVWWSRFRRFAWWKVTGALVGSMFIFGASVWNFLHVYQKERLWAFINPEAYSDSAGWLILNNREVLLNAGWFGHSGGAEMMTQRHTNFAFLNIIASYGWISAIVLVMILSVFLWRLSVSVGKTNDPFGKLLIFGASVLFGMQTLYNLAMTFGLLVHVEMPLPFISYGVTHTIINAFLIGIILSVYRRKDLIPKAIL